MHRGRLAAWLTGIGLLLATAGNAAAAAPDSIYEDLRDGKLDASYSATELERALHAYVRSQTPAATRATAPGKRAAPAKEKARALPFTGLDVALFTAGGGPLLLLGAAMRRRLTPRAAAAAAKREDSLTLAEAADG